MQGLYDCMKAWQVANQKRFLSVSIQKDGGNYCCIALTNPTEVVITDRFGNHAALVTEGQALLVKESAW
jgi:hypothetical protein